MFHSKKGCVNAGALILHRRSSHLAGMADGEKLVRLCAIAPCFNEELNIAVLVTRMKAVRKVLPIDMRLLLVDDGSSDGTWDRIQEFVRADPGFVLGVRHLENLGMAKAWQSGLERADEELVCLIDADLQNPPEAIPSMLAAFREQPGCLVQGVRTPAWRSKSLRYWASRALNTLLNLSFRDQASDNKSGFVLGERTAVLNAVSQCLHFRYPQTFLRIAALRAGVPIVELRTLFMERQAGHSFVETRGVFRVATHSALDVLKGLRVFRRSTRPRAHIDLSVSDRPRQSDSMDAARLGLGLQWYFRTMPLHGWLIRPEVSDVFSNLRTSQWLSPDNLRELQDRRLRRLIQHAARSVPYFRRGFAETGVSPFEIQTVDDLANLPLLSKDDVRNSVHFDLFAEDVRYRDLHKISTSGSTGEPFTVYADRFQLETRFATTVRALEWTGWRFGQRQLRLWHQKIGMTSSQAFRERVDAFLMRRSFVPAFEMTEESLEQLVQRIESWRPILIDGYAESFNLLAQYIAAGRKLRHKPLAVVSSAQTLTMQTREQIEGALGAKVYDKYGAREFSGIAYQCGYSDEYHVMDESYVVEILRDGRRALPGEVGEVVITDLNNYSFPLIRYRIGDLAVAAESDSRCPCGRGLSRIGPIQGRTQALVHCANGRWLPGTFFAHFFKDFSHLVRHYQIVQERAGSFTILVVRGEYWSDESDTALIGGLRPYVGMTQVEIRLVDHIPLLVTGKRTAVVSSVAVDFQGLR